jgi:hypothetical protein
MANPIDRTSLQGTLGKIEICAERVANDICAWPAAAPGSTVELGEHRTRKAYRDLLAHE